MAGAPRNPFICSFKRISSARVPVCGIHDSTSGLGGATNRVETETCDACWVNDSLDQHPCQHLVPRTLIAAREGGSRLMDVRWVCQAYKMDLDRLDDCGTTCPKWRRVGDGSADDDDDRDRDALLGTYNRRYLDEKLTKEFAYAQRTPSPLCLVLADIDDFKKVNDTYGHVAGDDVLKFVAATARQTVEPKGLVARYGGEEIAIVLPNYALSEAMPLAERVRAAIEAYPFAVDAGDGAQPLRVTLSLGVSPFEHAMAGPRDLVAASDRCLYEAKRLGKNRVVGPSAPTAPARRRAPGAIPSR